MFTTNKVSGKFGWKVNRTRQLCAIYMGKVVGSRFGFRTVLSFVPESGVCRSYKSVPFPERLPQISGNGMKDGFEEIEHEFPMGKKQDYLLGCFSLGPGSALGEKGKKNWRAK